MSASVIPFRRPLPQPIRRTNHELSYADQLLVRKARMVLKTLTPVGDMSIDRAKTIIRLEVGRVLNGGTPVPQLDYPHAS